MALSANQFYEGSPRGGTGSHTVKDATVIYRGAAVGLDANGYLDNWANTANLTWLGFAQEKVTGSTSATPPVRCRVDESGDEKWVSSITGASGIGDKNDLVYASDENTFTLTEQSNTEAVGWIKDYDSGKGFRVQFFTPAEYQTGRSIIEQQTA